MSPEQLKNILGITSQTTWIKWCNIANVLPNQESYSEEEINRFNQLSDTLKTMGKFNEKEPLIIRESQTITVAPQWVYYICGIQGIFLGFIFAAFLRIGFCSPQPTVQSPQSITPTTTSPQPQRKAKPQFKTNP